MEVAAKGGAPLRRVAVAVALGVLLSTGASADDPAAAPRVLRVATSGDYAPFSFEVSSGDGREPKLDGFDVEVATRFARDRGYRLELVRFRWPELARELAAGSFDVAMSGVTVRPERSVVGRLSVPVAATQAVAVAWKGSNAENMGDLDKPGRRVAVNAGGHLEKVAHEVFRRAEVIPIADNAAVRMALLDRTVDAVVTDNFEQPVWTGSEKGFVTLGPLSDDRKAYLLPADRADLARELDRWLLEREKDGSLRELRARYFRAPDGKLAEAAAAPTADPLSALAAAIRERLAIMPLVWEAKKIEKRPIEDKEQEAAVLDAASRAVAAEVERVPGRAAPDAKAVRDLFGALIEAGKDAQRKLAETEARRRPGVVHHRPPGDGAAATNADASDPKAAERAADAGTGSPGSAPAGDPPRVTGPDLARDIRPAIARITEKIAIILASMSEPVATRDVRQKLHDVLADDVDAELQGTMAFAIATISSRPENRGQTPN